MTIAGTIAHLQARATVNTLLGQGGAENGLVELTGQRGASGATRDVREDLLLHFPLLRAIHL